MPRIEIRPATVGDVPLIHAFITELADYEKLRHEMVASEEQIRDTLFGEKRYSEVLIASLDGTAVGFALYFPNYSTFLGKPGVYLEDLFVRPAARGAGVGKRLLQELAKITVDRGWGRLQWCVLDWNEPAIAFYNKIGGEMLDDWRIYRVTGEALKKLAAGD